MGTDFWIVLRWWGTLFLVGAAAFPLTKALFGRPTSPSLPAGKAGLRGAPFANGRDTPKLDGQSSEGWYDQGYLFSKAVGMVVVTYLVYLFGILHWIPFTQMTVLGALAAVFVLGLILNKSLKSPKSLKGKTIFLEELFFFACLLFWSWVKGHEASIHGLEKFMDFGFTKSILNSAWFPAPDMWFAGSSINYYYFGHTVMAMLTKLSGIDLTYTFNLMLAGLFAFTATMSFSIGRQLMRGTRLPVADRRDGGQVGVVGEIGGGILTAWLVTLAGNMQTIYAFTRGYTGEDVQPLWKLAWKMSEFWTKLPEGLERYWYANATRFIPFTIHEFPSYSFVVSDVHGHVLSLPFTLLAIALLVMMFGLMRDKKEKGDTKEWLRYAFYGLLVSILLMTNALDGPIYIGLFIILFIISNWTNLTPIKSGLTNWTNWKAVGIVVGVAALASLPFLLHFSSFVSGLAVNCPPAFLADRKIGILLFETVDKCQKSPFWMMWLLWGFFWFCGISLIISKLKRTRGDRRIRRIRDIREIWSTEFTQSQMVLVVFFIFSVLLLIFPEFFYFKDIYPAHFRSNTMFKLGYQAFIMFSIISGYTIVHLLFRRKQHAGEISNIKYQISNRWTKIFMLLLIPQLFLVSIYPIFSIRSYFDSLRTYKGLDGAAWLAEQYPDDYQAIEWLNNNVTMQQRNNATMPVIIEADGDSYTDSARISAFTGLASVIGWPVHEWLWRGTYDVVAPRREEVRQVYESQNLDETRAILAKYNVSYIVVGAGERQKYPTLFESKFSQLGRVVFASGGTTIYLVDPDKDRG